MTIQIHTRINEIEQDAWKALSGTDDPFVRYEFHAAMEKHAVIGEKFGWLPHYIGFYQNDRLDGLLIVYVKDNSYGEFVFDWSWADAYARHGLSYYPKAVVSIPYTPVSGPRLFIRQGSDQNKIAELLINTALALCQTESLSSLHWLFTDESLTEKLCNHGMLKRVGVQFHWHNHNYQNFDDFLSTLMSRKRKNIKKERQSALGHGLTLQCLHGNELTPTQWQEVAGFYALTFYRKSGYPTFNYEFFKEIGQTMGEQIVIMFAYKDQKPIACAINYRSNDTLYGRHWGCLEQYNHLHFELCYYQGIDYCIKHKLARFEPGAQGEHKISRGFIPVKTYSAHYLAHPGFAEAIRQYLEKEEHYMDDYIEELESTVPYRKDGL